MATRQCDRCDNVYQGEDPDQLGEYVDGDFVCYRCLSKKAVQDDTEDFEEDDADGDEDFESDDDLDGDEETEDDDGPEDDNY